MEANQLLYLLSDGASTLPNGYFIQYGGQLKSEQCATNNLLVFSILAVIVIAVLAKIEGSCNQGQPIFAISGQTETDLQCFG